MKNKKLQISLFEFLQTGRFGPFTPQRNCSPEDITKIFGQPDSIEIYGAIGPDGPYRAGDERCFPVILAYGVIEFHFDAPLLMYTLFSDCFFSGRPRGGSLKLKDTALLRHSRPLNEFLVLAKSRGLEIRSAVPTQPPLAVILTTSEGVTLHFEHEDASAPGSQATLRAFSWAHDFRDRSNPA